MLAKVMKRKQKLMPAQTNKVATAMGKMVDIVAEYRTHNAIGYTFVGYATQMHSNKEIKLLAINDVAPTVENNIRNGGYPYTVDVYMVTREHPTAENTKAGGLVSARRDNSWW